MANEPIECKGLSSVALYLCQSENGEISEDVVEETWSCVKDEFIKAHGTEDELFRLANVGYVAEPQGHRIFVNNPSKLEIQ